MQYILAPMVTPPKPKGFMLPTSLALLLLLGGPAGAQSFWAPADSFDARRFVISAGAGAGLYAGTMTGLAVIWYAETERSGFHTFNDWGEWRNMDKWGHIITAYQESRWITQGARWTGMDRRQAIWLGAGTAFLLQGSIELLDAYSAKWGFSWYDLGANTAGCLLFAGQEWLWQEQRLGIKVSIARPAYPEEPWPDTEGMAVNSPAARARQLFGRQDLSRLVKDYNAQTYWLTIRPAAFLSQSPPWLPQWLNLALGVRGDNLYGGFGNQWTDEATGLLYRLDPQAYPRRSRYFLSLDAAFSRIPVRSPFWRSVLHALDFVKLPFPALELRSDGMLRGHWLYF
jgi:hypothetical protein